MALSLTRVRGQDLTFAITGGGTITAIRDLKIDAKISTFEATAATATYDQKTLGRFSISGTYSMWVGTGGIPPAVGDSITVLSASVSSDEVTQANIDSSAVYGVLKVTSVGQAFQDSPGITTVGFEGGFLS